MQPDIGPLCLLQLQFMSWADAALSQVPEDQASHDLGSSFKSLFGTLSHVYRGELIWLKRVQGDRDATLAGVDSPADLGALVHQAWIDLVAPLRPVGQTGSLRGTGSPALRSKRFAANLLVAAAH